uniref:BPTI/Kunitz inhibitor domain-containing protein n=2 Tax=Dendroctonus ponderosae TaxID=77166 RepID=A0AAR5Q9C0_DENPD
MVIALGFLLLFVLASEQLQADAHQLATNGMGSTCDPYSGHTNGSVAFRAQLVGQSTNFAINSTVRTTPTVAAKSRSNVFLREILSESCKFLFWWLLCGVERYSCSDQNLRDPQVPDSNCLKLARRRCLDLHGDKDSSTTNNDLPDVMCRLPEMRGHCRALIMRWRYDPETGKCDEFGFGGCDGNSNNFPTRKACMDMCAEVR